MPPPRSSSLGLWAQEPVWLRGRGPERELEAPQPENAGEGRATQKSEGKWMSRIAQLFEFLWGAPSNTMDGWC